MCGCGSYDNDTFETKDVTFEVRATIRDTVFESIEHETLNVRDALEDTYGIGSVQDLELTIISETDPTSGIRHFAGVEG